MAGLGSLTATSSSTNTELPSWVSSAQQDVIGRAQQGASQIPLAQNTTGQGAVNLLQGPNNPFQQAQGVLGDIASGASNPWTVDSSGGVTGNNNTALGGLYNAQNQYLQQIMPEIDAGASAGAIGSGNFGSLRGQTALQKARGDAFSKLSTEQLGNALTAQSQGAQAAAALSNSGTQNIDEALKTAAWQQTSPLAAASGLGKVISGIGPTGTNVTKTANESPLKTAGILGDLATNSPLARSAIGALTGTDLSRAGASDVLGTIYKNTIGRIGGGGGANPGGSGGVALPGGGVRYSGQGGYSTIANPDGSYNISQPDGTTRMIGADGTELGIIPAEADYSPPGSAFEDTGPTDESAWDYTYPGEGGDTSYSNDLGSNELFDYSGDF